MKQQTRDVIQMVSLWIAMILISWIIVIATIIVLIRVLEWMWS